MNEKKRHVLKDGQLTLDAQRFETVFKVPSAHDPNKYYTPYKKNGRWYCDGPDGPCEHFKRWHTPCRHILQAKYQSLKEIYDDIKTLAELRREEKFTDTFDDVITYMKIFKKDEFNQLCTLALHIAIYQGTVCADDLQDATGEVYENAKIFGTVFAQLQKEGLLEVDHYKKSKRGHHRTIFVFRPTEKAKQMIASRRPEPIMDGIR